MKEFLSRINETTVYDFIDLNENEKKLYNGAGQCLVAVENAEIFDILYLNRVTKSDEIKEFRQKHKSHYFFGMMSCYQFCQPIPEPIATASAMRWWGDNCA